MTRTLTGKPAAWRWSVRAIGCLFFAFGVAYKFVRGIRDPGDFSSFWTAARALAEGHDPYAAYVAAVGSAHLLPFISPVYVAALIWPLGFLPLGLAKACWVLCNMGLLLVLGGCLLRLAAINVTASSLTTAIMVLLAFNPVTMTPFNGQTDIIVVAAMAASL